jgi:cysteine desulfurase/selenocysteine lyase
MIGKSSSSQDYWMDDTKIKTEELDLVHIKADFPILNREIKPGVPLLYLDSAATSQKPLQVLQEMDTFNTHSYANIHRGIHTLAEEATQKYELARKKVSEFIGSPSPKQVIFTRNTTESINLVVQSWGRKNLSNGDLVVLTEMEHHSNIVPWQMLAQEMGFRLEFIPVNESGLLDLEVYKNLIKMEPKAVGFTHMSNVLGTINPAMEIIQIAHESGAITIVDGAQSVPHIPVNVQELDADFLAFSGHKMCGPSGIGVLYGKKDLLKSMPPFLGGGDMIKRVELNSFTTNEIPYKFEAGTPAITEAIGLGAAIDYLNSIGMDRIADHEQEIVSYALERMVEVPGVDVIGPEAAKKGAVVSFSMASAHPHDISQILDSKGIAIRAGHHCAMPLHNKLKLPASARASFYLYNSKEEVDQLAEALYSVLDIFGI